MAICRRPGVLLKKPRVRSLYCLVCSLLFPGLNSYSNLASRSPKCSLDLPLEWVRECGGPCHLSPWLGKQSRHLPRHVWGKDCFSGSTQEKAGWDFAPKGNSRFQTIFSKFKFRKTKFLDFKSLVLPTRRIMEYGTWK